MTVQLIQFCPSLQLLQRFFQNITLKGYVIDTEMNGYHCCNFTEKLSYKVWTPSNRSMSNFHFDLSLKGEVQIFSEEMRTSPQNRAMLYTDVPYFIVLLLVYCQTIFLVKGRALVLDVLTRLFAKNKIVVCDCIKVLLCEAINL